MIPTYLRIVVTTDCSLKCAFCHMEGDPAQDGQRGGPSIDVLQSLVAAAYQEGIRKFKLLGGEPLLRPDFPKLVAALRSVAPDGDLSIITAGVVPLHRLLEAFAAGLDRANLSIHGWSPAMLARNARDPGAHAKRQRVLEAILQHGAPLKCNYVYTGPEVEADLQEFLAWSADKPLVVSVLDNLGDAAMGPATIKRVLQRLRGPWTKQWREEDPRSLPTLRLQWADGLTVEIKDHQLGQIAPWKACNTCPEKAKCREGIFALRLKHTGHAAPCMDRPDLNIALIEVLAQGGVPAVRESWRKLMAA